MGKHGNEWYGEYIMETHTDCYDFIENFNHNKLTLDYFFTHASDEEVRAVASMIIYRFEDKFKNLFKISEFGHSLTDKELDEFAKELRNPQ